MKTPTFTKMMENNSRLATLLHKAKLLIEINQYLQKNIDAESAQHCQAVNINNDCLILFADSAAWRLRLQFSQTTLMTILQIKYPYIKGIEIRIHPYKENKKNAVTKYPPISPESREIIAETAINISDTKLKAALLCLAEKNAT